MTKTRDSRRFEAEANIFERLFVLWPGKLIHLPLTINNMLVPSEYDELARTEPAFEFAFRRFEGRRAQILLTLCSVFKSRFLTIALLALAYQAAMISSPIILRALIIWFGGSTQNDLVRGLLLVVALFVAQLLEALVGKHQWSEAWKTAHAINLLVRSQVYSRFIKLNPKERERHSIGEITTLCGSDGLKIGQISFIHMIWTVPLGLVIASCLLFAMLGWASIIGIIIILLSLYLSIKINEGLLRVQPKIRQGNSERINLLSEVLSGIRVIKYYCWEQWAEDKITNQRSSLLRTLSIRQMLLALLYVVNSTAPVVAIMACIILYVGLGGELHAGNVFASVLILSILRAQAPELIRVTDYYNQYRISSKKFEIFIMASDTKCRPQSQIVAAEIGTVSIEKRQIVSGGVTLGLEDLTIVPGELVCVVGAVGSGKSSLLRAISEGADEILGGITTVGTVVYLPQEAWIMNATIVENITMGRQIDWDHYRAVIQACALEADVVSLPDADNTVVGERGVTLSGGQKQRIALARAAYCGADIYLLDDPLSAVDVHVALAIYENLICGLLKTKTRILVTHRMEFAKRAERVLFVEAGNITEIGAPSQLTAKLGRGRPLIEPTIRQDVESCVVAEVEAGNAFLRKEDARQPAAQSMPVQKTPVRGLLGYIREVAPGSLLFGFIALYLTSELLRFGQLVWLGHWTEHAGDTLYHYAGGFLAISVTMVILAATTLFFGFFRGVKASMKIHWRMLHAVLHAPVAFFDTTPSGEMISRFSGDTEIVDLDLPRDAINFIGLAVATLVAAGVLVSKNLIVSIALAFIILIFRRWQKQTRDVTVEISRIARAERGPLLSHITQTYGGMGVIASCGAQEWFIENFTFLAERTRNADYSLNSIARYFNIRLDYVSAIFIGAYGTLLILSAGKIPAGLAGADLSIAYAFVESFRASLAAQRNVEASLSSYERISAYSALDNEEKITAAVPSKWRTTGDILFQNVTMTYPGRMTPAIRDVSFHITTGERIGIVGRTGAGKSSLFQCLVRFVSIDSGTIAINGKDVAQVPLKALRSSIAIVPQDPVIFSGTIRMNIDPLNEYDDDMIVKVLQKVQLWERVAASEKGMEELLGFDGAAFSAGEKQLLCLARALLRESKIILIDELSGNLDPLTESKIRNTLHSELREATVLTIAHRIETILESDQIFVMSAGKLVESGAPSRLVAVEGGVFQTLLGGQGATLID